MGKITKGKNSKRYTPEQKLEAVLLNISGSKTIKEIAAEMQTVPSSINNWKNEFFAKAAGIFADKPRGVKPGASQDQKTIERLGKEVQLLKKLLTHYRQTRGKQSSKPPGK